MIALFDQQRETSYIALKAILLRGANFRAMPFRRSFRRHRINPGMERGR
ncbi:Hypothetical protein GbCGDNIH9_7277 [Granulibacter bethesdensis]|uniref:Uncharacterized protein n=1 Tax=Granulibacter bethesdensis TaxID=364410 RepID=A0AAC9P8V5_9PROT|nr:Hypothetical protein GbCGDNIH9_7277 [Granulibacter bethesdensis]APH62518.1 Hypothetical protein GbCGDNIH8_8615 [Granulibacter bethesdensis]